MTYEPGSAVTLQFDIGLAAEPDTVRVVVENQDGEVVGQSGVSNVSLDVFPAYVIVTIQPGANTLPGGVTEAHRLVRLFYTAPDEFAGQRSLELDYRLRLGPPLTLQVNSFQSYNEAVMMAAEISGLERFKAASRDDRVAALKDAWLALIRLRFTVDEVLDQTRLTDAPGRHPYDLSEWSAEEFQGLDARFRRALVRAQIVEADEILAGGGVLDRRLQGIMSSTIGETSQMFRAGKPVDRSVSARALKELRGYVSFAVRLARGS